MKSILGFMVLLPSSFSFAMDLNAAPVTSVDALLTEEVTALPVSAPVLIAPVVKAPVVHTAMPREMQRLRAKYDVSKIGARGVGKGMNFYSVDREMELGQQIADEADRQLRLVMDPVITEYVNRLAQNLARNSDTQVPFNVRVVDSDEVNAFALPGGYFYVNTGLILAADNEAELAGVMAHEIAHVAARHATHNLSRRNLISLCMLPTVFVAGPVGLALLEAQDMVVPMTFLKFSRDAEREADLLGMQYSYATGYDPAAVVTFFEKTAAREKQKKVFLARAFDTHPMTSERVRRAQEELNWMLPAKEDYRLTTNEFNDVKERLEALVKRHVVEDPANAKPVLRKAADGSEQRPTLKRVPTLGDPGE